MDWLRKLGKPALSKRVVEGLQHLATVYVAEFSEYKVIIPFSLKARANTSQVKRILNLRLHDAGRPCLAMAMSAGPSYLGIS